MENLRPSSSLRVDSQDYILVPSSSSSDDGGAGVSQGSVQGKAVRRGTEGHGSWEVDGSDGEEEPEHIDLELRVDLLGARRRKNGKRKRKYRKMEKRPLIWEVLEDENEKWIDEHEKDEVDLDGGECAVKETAEPPSDLIMPLLRFQMEWLAWALKQEESPIKGGILADEMGMGKTIQAISLVLAARSSRPAYQQFQPSMSRALPRIKGTLVICPLVAVVQWVNEITSSTVKGSVNVLVYHGAKREKAIQHLSTYDFVLTTYSTVAADYRKNDMRLKQPRQAKKKQREIFGGAKKKLQAVQEEEDEDVVDDLKPVIRKGAERSKKRGPSSNKDKVGSCNHEPEDERSLPEKSILHSIKWERIILDEAHYIKDPRSHTARAVCSLQSLYKWALSGTPIQNQLKELYSLIHFLQITPYSCYYCKDCNCKALDYSSTVCPNCDHRASKHFCWWTRFVAKPIRKGRVFRKRALIFLNHKLLNSVMLRHTKKGRAADLALPPRFVSSRWLTLDKREEGFYESLYTKSQAKFDEYVEAGTLMTNYAHIFVLLTRLRQAVDHLYLASYSKSNPPSASKIDNAEQQECGLCHDPSEDPVVTSCEHVFCKTCLLDYSTALGQVSCPSCSRPLTVDFTTMRNPDDCSHSTSIKGFRRSSILNKINLEGFQTSTKIEALREEIRNMFERDGSAKAIVFSQFTSFLDLINYSLQKSGINCVQLVGSMSIAARDDAIKKFNDDPECRIFLMSLKAGGVALNLTVASYVFLMDPWWNPAAELQAQDRIHRIGQNKPIRIVKFVIENTIERILELQEEKELLFKGTVGGSSEAFGRLTESNLRVLFDR